MHTETSSRRYVKTRKPGVYYRTLADGGRRYSVMVSERGKPAFVTVPGGGEREAVEFRAGLLVRKGRGEKVTPGKTTFVDFAALWLEQERPRLGERTYDHYERQLRLHLLPVFGRLKLTAIDDDRIAAFIARMSETHSPSSVRAALVPLSRVLNRAVRKGLLAQNPMKTLEAGERPRVEKRERRILDRDEIARLVQHTDECYRLLISAAIWTGLRQSELLGLTWGDVDFDAGAIRVRKQLSRKTGARKALKTPAAERDVLLAPSLAVEFRAHRLASASSGPDDFVFAGRNGRALDWSNVMSRGLRPACVRAGLREPRPRFHDLRHTYASLLIANGADVVFVSRQMGHSSPALTLKVYADEFERAEHGDRFRALLDAEIGSTRASAARGTGGAIIEGDFSVGRTSG